MAKRRSKKRKPRAPRNMIVVGMILTKRAAAFRHRADRRPEDDRKRREELEDE